MAGKGQSLFSHHLSRASQTFPWRIDVTIAIMAQRVAALSAEQLDWSPPDNGWTLRQMMCYLAQAEIYYAIWLDEVLPDEALARYLEARALQPAPAPALCDLLAGTDGAVPARRSRGCHY